MKIYALSGYETLVKKEWSIERFIFTCKDKSLIGLGAYRATSTKDDANVLKESLSDLVRLFFKPVGAIGGVRVDDEIDGVTFAVVGNDLYEY